MPSLFLNSRIIFFNIYDLTPDRGLPKTYMTSSMDIFQVARILRKNKNKCSRIKIHLDIKYLFKYDSVFSLISLNIQAFTSFVLSQYILIVS